MTNQAIYRQELRSQITFAEVPSAETCKQVRKYGYNFDRRSGQCHKSEVQGNVTDEQSVLTSIQG